MKALVLIAVLAMSGCQTMHEHPRATALVAATLITSVAISARGHRDEQMIATPSVDCSRTSCQ